MASSSHHQHLSYGPAYLARGLFVALLVPMSVIALEWRVGATVEIPEFIVVWFATWICTLLLSMKIPLRRWASYSLHWIVYLGACSILIYEWRATCLLQGLASLLWWALFDSFERLYMAYKQGQESTQRAKVLEARIRPRMFRWSTAFCCEGLSKRSWASRARHRGQTSSFVRRACPISS